MEVADGQQEVGQRAKQRLGHHRVAAHEPGLAAAAEVEQPLGEGVAPLAVGGERTDSQDLRFSADRNAEERADALANIVKASCGEASMMARCTGKTNLHNLEPEDMRALTVATRDATDILLAGKH